ncbi:MAG TPA: Xaa-Pro peptidase family protein [Candidatus Dormibacteraeota bacterium]|nr:Xaa-Pro peptidase family protein [Candidatus Dormibacteraeota bacterium]
MDYVGRRSAVLSLVRDGGADRLLVTNPAEVRYLSGFAGSTAVLLVAERSRLFVDFRYREQASAQVAGVEVRSDSQPATLWTDVLGALEGEPGSLAIDPQRTTAAQYLDLAGRGRAPVPLRGVVDRLRSRKDAEEIALLRQAHGYADAVAEEVIGELRVGMSERLVAGMVELIERRLGAEKSAVDVLVGSGPRSSLPHSAPTARELAPGDPVVMDISPTAGGYRSDLTRTVHIGPATPRFREIYNVVLCALEAAERSIRPGLTGREADALARDVITGAGYGDNFQHSLGHSIGLDQHEWPRVSPHDGVLLEEGMVLAVEPAIYVPGFGGVRIEDVVLLTGDGCEVLTQCPRTLIEI